MQILGIGPPYSFHISHFCFLANIRNHSVTFFWCNLAQTCRLSAIVINISSVMPFMLWQCTSKSLWLGGLLVAEATRKLPWESLSITSSVGTTLLKENLCWVSIEVVSTRLHSQCLNDTTLIKAANNNTEDAAESIPEWMKSLLIMKNIWIQWLMLSRKMLQKSKLEKNKHEEKPRGMTAPFSHSKLL